MTKTNVSENFLSDSLKDLLLKVLNLSALSDMVITPIGGGITNLNYRIDANGEVFVLRIGGKGAEKLGINREYEHAATAIAADLGIGAKLIYSDIANDLLITQFISGQALTPEMAVQPATLKKIADIISRYHNGKEFSGIFSPFEIVRSYHKLAVEHGVYFPPSAIHALGVMEKIKQAIGPLKDLKPCHNDLLAANFIDDGKSIYLIDWEYAAMGDPFFDLGNFAANQELTEESCKQLLQFYFGELKQKHLSRLYLMRFVSDLRESFWGFLQSGISALDFDFREYALKHLERFLKNTEDQQFSNYLMQCDERD